MALVIPYGDTQAHGSIGDALTFRRWRGRVVLEKKPYPRQPDSGPQIVHRNKFREGWIAFHTLNAQTLKYYTDLAAQLGMTPANLFLSYYLRDIVPSSDPLTEIVRITDLDLPEPNSLVSKGTKIDFLGFFDFDESVESFGHIFDSENIFIEGVDISEYDRALLEIERGEPDPFLIPLNYPVLVKWRNAAEEDKIILVRLPEIAFPTDDPSSSQIHMTLLKQITELEIGPIGSEDYQFIFSFNWFTLYPTLFGSIVWIEDKKNELLLPAISPSHDKFYIEISGNNSPPQSIPADYPISIVWKDFEDLPHSINLLLPELQLEDGGSPSGSHLVDMKKINDLEIIHPVGSGSQNVDIVFGVWRDPEGPGHNIAHIYDTMNAFYYLQETETYIALYCEVRVRPPYPVLFPRNYSVGVWWTDSADNEHFNFFLIPFWNETGFIDRRFFLSDDWSSWNDIDLTDSAISARINTKKLYVARDWSLYWDDDLTDLAKPGLGSKKKLWLAKDFSVYWDKALTQIANTPYL